MLKLKLQYFGHLMQRVIGKDSDAGRDWGQEEKGMAEDEYGWMASPTWWTWVWVNSGSWWWTRRPGVLLLLGSQSLTQLSNWAELNWRVPEREFFVFACDFFLRGNLLFLSTYYHWSPFLYPAQIMLSVMVWHHQLVFSEVEYRNRNVLSLDSFQMFMDFFSFPYCCYLFYGKIREVWKLY